MISMPRHIWAEDQALVTGRPSTSTSIAQMTFDAGDGIKVIVRGMRCDPVARVSENAMRVAAAAAG